MAALQLYDLIFEQILNVSRCTGGSGWGCLTGDITHDVIFAFFLPHIVLLIFLFMLREYPPFDGHKGLGNLFAVGAYVLIIYQGWYGAILAPFMVLWMFLIIVMALGYFFLPMVGSAEQRKKVGKKAGKTMEKATKKSRKLNEIEGKIKEVRKEKKHAKKMKRKARNRDHDEEAKNWHSREVELDKELRELKREKKKLR